jgi:transcriptional regulator with XRE-family HTH domain
MADDQHPIQEARIAKALSLDDVARKCELDKKTVIRAERAQPINHESARILSTFFGRTPRELGILIRGQPPIEDEGATASTDPDEFEPTAPLTSPTLSEHDDATASLTLTFDLLSPKIAPDVVNSIERSTQRLGRLYPVEPPAAVLPRVHKQLRVIRDLLKGGGARLPDHARLLSAAAWHCLLLAMLHYDQRQFGAAEATRNAAESLGQQVGDSNVIGWAYETAAWFAIYDGANQEIIDAAQQGLAVSPENSSAQVMNMLKLGLGQARVGRELEAEHAIERAQEIAQGMERPDYPDHHFTFDAPNKLDMYVARIYAFLGKHASAEQHARDLIKKTIEERSQYPVPPTREYFGRLDLASALIDRDELEEACAEASQAFGTILRNDVVERAIEISTRLMTRDPNNPAVKEFHMRCTTAQWDLASESDTTA